MHGSREKLAKHKEDITRFLLENLKIELHPDKSKVINLEKGILFLGFKVFYHYKLLKKSNIQKFRRKIAELKKMHCQAEVEYDSIYDVLEGWNAYAKQANTYNLRKKIAADIEKMFPNEISAKEIDNMLKE